MLSCVCKAQPRKIVITLPLVVQVNGTLVTHSNHIEVVKLIKCKFFCLFYSLNVIQH